MSEGRHLFKGYAFQSFAFRTWGLDGNGAAGPSHSGWISRPADRLSVSPVQQRVAITSTQSRVWIARIENE